MTLSITLGGLAFVGVLMLRWMVSREQEQVYRDVEDLRAEIKSIRAAAPPGVDHPPRAGADLTMFVTMRKFAHQASEERDREDDE